MRYSMQWMEALRDRLAADAEWARRHRGLSAALSLGFGDARFRVVFRDGVLVSVRAGIGLTQAWDFAIQASVPSWDVLLASVPAPRQQSLFALMKAGELTIEGDMERFMQHVWGITRLIEVMRTLATGDVHGTH